MNPETVIAALAALITSIVPEPYAGKLQTAVRDYFATLGQQSVEEAKNAAAKENAAVVVSEILPTVVDSPLPSTPTPSPTPAAADPVVVTPPAPAEPTPPTAEPTPEPAKPEPPKKNDGRNKAPVF